MNPRTDKAADAALLKLRPISPTVVDVTVGDDPDATRHRVTVSDQDLKRLAPGATREELLRFAFRFLLEHEPRGSILRTFDITVIEGYFPDFAARARGHFHPMRDAQG